MSRLRISGRQLRRRRIALSVPLQDGLYQQAHPFHQALSDWNRQVGLSLQFDQLGNLARRDVLQAAKRKQEGGAA